MPKAIFGLDAENEPEDLQGFAVYDGPTPVPPSLYETKLTMLQLKLNKNGENMLNGILTIDEPRGSDKAKYNGYGIWFNQNVTQQSAPFLKAQLSAFGISWKDFNTKTVLDQGEPAIGQGVKVLKLGGVKVESEPRVRVTTKSNEYPKGSNNVSLQPVQWLPATSSDDADDTDTGEEEDLF